MQRPVFTSRRAPAAAGFTLLELMVVVAVVGVVLALAAPSFRELIEMRRLRGTTEQLLTDVQFARTEAASRQEIVGVAFHPNPVPGGLSCYTIYTVGTANHLTTSCDCSLAAGARCTAPLREIKTVQLDTSSSLLMTTVGSNGTTPLPGRFTFDPATGAMTSNFAAGITMPPVPAAGEVWIRTTLVSTGRPRSLRMVINLAGRPKVCLPPGSTVKGVATC